MRYKVIPYGGFLGANIAIDTYPKNNACYVCNKQFHPAATRYKIVPQFSVYEFSAYEAKTNNTIPYVPPIFRIGFVCSELCVNTYLLQDPWGNG